MLGGVILRPRMTVLCQVSLRKGSSVKWDHAQLVSAHWLLAAEARMAVYVQRVDTDDNIADLPSRGSFHILRRLGAMYVQPRLEPCFRASTAWSILQDRWAGQSRS